jgi:hypothetical protein
MQLDRSSRHRSVNQEYDIESFFLGISIPVALVLVILLKYVLPYFIATPDPSQAAHAFLSAHVGNCHPKPLEQARYITAITFVPAAYLAAYLYFQKMSKSPLIERIVNPLLLLASRLSIFSVVAFAFLYQTIWNYRYFRWSQIATSTLLCCLGLYVWYYRPVLKKRILRLLEITLSSSKVTWLLVILISIYGLIPGYATERNITNSNNIFAFHLPYYVGDFFSIMSGKYPFVNFYPMYQNVLSMLLSPIYFILGFKLSVFTFSMVLLSFIGLILTFAAFSRVITEPWKRLPLFLPVLAGGMYSINDPYGTHVANSFLYYANWPIRLFGPSLMLFLISRFYAGKQQVRNKAFIYFIGSWVALNNLDFGLSSFGATILAVSCWEILKNKKLKITLFVKEVSLAGAVSLLSLSIYSIVLYILSGHFPNFLKMTTFIQVFAKYGYGMEPAPPIGLYWIIYLTFMTAIVRSLIVIWNTSTPSNPQKLRVAMLLYSGIFGAGSMMYFMGRSHPYTLIVFFFSWAISLVLLMIDFMESFEIGRRTGILRPTFYAFSYCLLITILFFQAPHLKGEVERLRSHHPLLESDINDIQNYLKDHIQQHEKIALLYPYADLVARNLQIVNTFAYADPSAIFLKDQINTIMETLETSQTKKVFGIVGAELKDRLIQSKFVNISSHRDLTLWKKP